MKPVRCVDFIQLKKTGRKLVMLTAYDCPTAALLDACGVDLILVGDSVGMVLLGYETTAPVTMDEMLHHIHAVRRGTRRAYLVGDLPLKGVEKGPRAALASAKRFLKEGGCDAVKLEWRRDAPRIAELFRQNRIPFMGHVGLTPQTVRQNAFRVKGRAASEAWEVFRAAKAFEEKGAFAVLLECVPEVAAKEISRALKVPTIGIGAGRFCDGQVLVFHDIVGIFTKFKPRFVKRYAELYPLMEKAVKKFVGEVKSRRFPTRAQAFSMNEEEWRQLKEGIWLSKR